jgi:hypothetical protein
VTVKKVCKRALWSGQIRAAPSGRRERRSNWGFWGGLTRGDEHKLFRSLNSKCTQNFGHQKAHLGRLAMQNLLQSDAPRRRASSRRVGGRARAGGGTRERGCPCEIEGSQDLLDIFNTLFMTSAHTQNRNLSVLGVTFWTFFRRSGVFGSAGYPDRNLKIVKNNGFRKV